MDENNQQRGGFEESDVNVFAVGKFGVALLLVTLLAMALLFGLFNFFKANEGGEAASIDPVKVFPQPQLEKTPIPDLRTVNAAEEQTLSSYGWVDHPKGVVRIPITRAMEMVVQKGLPVRAATPPTAEGVTVPTDSGLGPKMQTPGGPLGEGK